MAVFGSTSVQRRSATAVFGFIPWVTEKSRVDAERRDRIGLLVCATVAITPELLWNPAGQIAVPPTRCRVRAKTPSFLLNLRRNLGRTVPPAPC